MANEENTKKNPIVKEDSNKVMPLKPNEKIIKITDIKIKPEYYPRFQINWEKVKEYAENFDKLPPPEVNQDDILTDGRHRIEAAKMNKLSEIKVVVKECPEDKVLLRATELNAQHGIQLSYKEKRQLAIKLFNGTNGKKLVQILSVSEDCFNKWVSDIRQKKEKKIQYDIIMEYLKAEQTMEKVAEKFGVVTSKVSETKNKFLEKINLLISKKDKATPEDKEEFDEICEFKPFITNIWNASKIVGGWGERTYDLVRLPPDIYVNIYHYFSEPFDVVYVPYHQDDTIIDVCKRWFRRYYVNNTKSNFNGDKIEKEWNFKKGLPKDLPPPNLVFININEIDDTSVLPDLLAHLRKRMSRLSSGYVVLFHPGTYNDKIVTDTGFILIERIVYNIYAEDTFSDYQVSEAKVSKTMLNSYHFFSVYKIGREQKDA